MQEEQVSLVGMSWLAPIEMGRASCSQCVRFRDVRHLPSRWPVSTVSLYSPYPTTSQSIRWRIWADLPRRCRCLAYSCSSLRGIPHFEEMTR